MTSLGDLLFRGLGSVGNGSYYGEFSRIFHAEAPFGRDGADSDILRNGRFDRHRNRPAGGGHDGGRAALESEESDLKLRLRPAFNRISLTTIQTPGVLRARRQGSPG